MSRYTLFLLLSLTLVFSAKADVVKPALIEIIAHTNGQIEIEVRASIEALLTGINSQYKNTQDAPNAEAYDALRVLPPAQLREKFTTFESTFLTHIYLKTRKKSVPLHIAKVEIPQVGYPKVPRISVIYLRGKISPQSQQLIWFYPEKFGNNAVRVKQANEAEQRWHWSQWQWLRHNNPSKAFSLSALFSPEPLWQTIFTYIELGISHIVPKGLDHILFILGLFLFTAKPAPKTHAFNDMGTAQQYSKKQHTLATRIARAVNKVKSPRYWPLLWQVTMFTIAHTITLGLAIYGWVELPAEIVEPLIALSIAYVAIENIFSQRLHAHRLALVFGFGLLHGLGFADVLQDLGMPEHAFFTALISFNIGVEIGQLLVLFIAFVALGVWCDQKPWYRTRIVIPLSLLIAVTGTYWALDRALLL